MRLVCVREGAAGAGQVGGGRAPSAAQSEAANRRKARVAVTASVPHYHSG